MSTGQYWYVSVVVAKGARPASALPLTSGVHGDEMSSVHTVQTVMGRLNAAEMSGTVMACWTSHALQWRACSAAGRVPDAFRVDRHETANGLAMKTASVPSAASRTGVQPAAQAQYDLAIDFHTGPPAWTSPPFHIGDMRIPT